MVRVRVAAFGFILCLLAVLALGTAVQPPQAWAKPVYTGGPDGTPYGNGDPTGDDVPSPTPKPTALQSARLDPVGGTVSERSTAPTSVRWSLYLSILVRLGLR